MHRLAVALLCSIGICPSINAEVFQIPPNGEGDSFPAIALAIAASEQSDDMSNVIQFGAGDYFISKSIRIRNIGAAGFVKGSERYGLLSDGKQLEFRGAGMDLTTIRIPVDSHAPNPMFVFDGVDHCKISELTLDGQVRLFNGQGWGRGPTRKRPSCGVFLFGAQHCHFQNVRFRDLGMSDTSETSEPVPSGANLVMACVESDESVGNYLPGHVNRALLRNEHREIVSPGIGRSCFDNKISACEFVDDPSTELPNPCTNFAIRMLTNWTSTKYAEPHEAQHTALSALVKENLIEDCSFSGGYFWNAVEIAGHGSVYNKVLRCKFNRCIQTPADIDKAASFNLFEDNDIIDTYARSIETRRAMGVTSLGTWTFAMRMQGYPSLNKGRRGREAIGNQFINNRINGVYGNTRATGAMLLSRTVDAVIRDNELQSVPRWATEEGQNYSGPEEGTAAIKIRSWAKNIEVSNNRFPQSAVDEAPRKNFSAIMEFSETGPTTAAIPDLPRAHENATIHQDITIVDYERGEKGSKSRFDWKVGS